MPLGHKFTCVNLVIARDISYVFVIHVDRLIHSSLCYYSVEQLADIMLFGKAQYKCMVCDMENS